MGTEIIFIIIATWICTIVFHELGHWAFARAAGAESNIILTIENKKVKLYTYIYDTDWNSFEPKKKINFYMAGIILGLFPLMVLASFYPFYYVFILIYLIPITSDVRAIQELNKQT